MSTGIVSKKTVKGSVQYDQHARRYVFYPLSNLAMPAPTPIWGTRIPKGRIYLLESYEYRTRGDDPEAELAAVRSGQSPLVLKTMGTDAQLAYLMGNSDGVGWLERGMTHLESIIDVDADTAEEIEKLILADEDGEISVPEDLIEFQALLRNKSFVGDNPVSALAEMVRLEMLRGVEQAIKYCNIQVVVLEKELNEGRSGRAGIKSLDAVQQYYWKQVRKPLPEDRVGSNMGNELAKVLAPLIQSAGSIAPPPVEGNQFQKDIELEELRKKTEEQERTIAEQAATIKELAEGEDEE